MDLDQLDAERGGPMVVLERGQRVVLPAASELHWKIVAAATVDPHTFFATVWPAGIPLTSWKLERAQAGWVHHNGLPSSDQVKRLVYTMEKYGDGVEYDLRHHLSVSAGQLWRDRRWRELLNYLDLLPSNSHMHRLLTTDEEYMEAILRRKTKDAPGAGKPSMSDWGQLESMIAVLIDAVNRNTAVNQAIANPKGPKPRIEPYPRPYSAADKIRNRIRREEHQEMVSKLLPGRSV